MFVYLQPQDMMKRPMMHIGNGNTMTPNEYGNGCIPLLESLGFIFEL